MEKRDSFIFYRSFHEALKQLPDDVRLQLYDAIAEYALSGGESKPMLSGVALSLWILIEPQLRANIQRYNNGKKGGDYGKLGGAPKGNKNATRTKIAGPHPRRNGSRPGRGRCASTGRK